MIQIVARQTIQPVMDDLAAISRQTESETVQVKAKRQHSFAQREQVGERAKTRINDERDEEH